MKVALVHEFLNQLGGAEKVLENFLEIWPDSAEASTGKPDSSVIHTILYSEKKTMGLFKKYKIKTSFLNYIPGTGRHPRLFLTMMPGAIESFDFSDFDVVLSDSSSFAHGAKAGNKLHICYCHTPARFLWTEKSYLQTQPYPGIFKMFGQVVLPKIKQWDLEASKRPHFYIANSENVKARLKKFYNRDSVVVPPPVDTEFFHTVAAKKDYYFTASRLEPYKKMDVIIQAFNELGLPLKIAGAGSAMNNLKKLAKPNIEFLGRVSDEDLRKYYSEAKAFVFAANEDAGIVLLEAQSCGTPVLAYRGGGALESVIAGGTGEFFEEQSKDSLVEAVKKFQPEKYDVQAIRANAEKFSKRNFQKKMKEFVEEKYREFSTGSNSINALRPSPARASGEVKT